MTLMPAWAFESKANTHRTRTCINLMRLERTIIGSRVEVMRSQYVYKYTVV